MHGLVRYDAHEGFLNGPKHAAAARAFHLRTVYLTRNCSIQIPFNLFLFGGKVEDQALVDRWSNREFHRLPHGPEIQIRL